MRYNSYPVSRNLNIFFGLALLILLFAGILTLLSLNRSELLMRNISGSGDEAAVEGIDELRTLFKISCILLFSCVSILFVSVGLLFLRIKKECAERDASESEYLNKIAGLEEQNKNKDFLYSIIAHDLRSPFQPILTLAEILHGDYNSLKPEEIKEYGIKLNNVGRNVLSLLDNLLDWSKVQTGRMAFNPEPFMMKEKAEWAINNLEMTADVKKIILLNDIDENIWVYADLNMILSVLHNLISNSIKFTMPGGIIRLSGEQSGGETKISVIDNGIGFNKEQMDNLFMIGVNNATSGTNKEKGTGLGLLLCKKLIEMHGGKINIQSNKGKGTKISFSIPDKIEEK